MSRGIVYSAVIPRFQGFIETVGPLGAFKAKHREGQTDRQRDRDREKRALNTHSVLFQRVIYNSALVSILTAKSMFILHSAALNKQRPVTTSTGSLWGAVCKIIHKFILSL